ncbi:esterase FE4-like [Orussus abietinus]|uniref:esterase FE4-like n=1 Tax=Orussus abietinus TaxID=222816 RepID=UPI000626BF33|nr:esterase FE4-like [Orussus abietinus]
MSSPVIKVKQGELRGTTLESVLGPSYFAFKGIPFAAPPVGSLRFKDPQPPAGWSGVRDASKHAGDVCAQQMQLPPFSFFGDEDCLYLNVYTTSLDEKRPVMVWIHGGGFTGGSGNETFVGPDYLIKENVILVTFNYRLGVLGFLNLDHKLAPGNQGLKDQVAALSWVKENIPAFGGDPENVTIFGESAGGASVHYLTLSPLAKGLFHKAIMQSGTATCEWAHGQGLPERSFKIAKILGSESTDPEEVVEFLREIPVDKLVEAQTKIITPEENVFLNLPIGPGVDDKSENPFLPHPVEKYAEKGIQVPVVIGHTTNEGIMFLKGIDEHSLDLYEKHLQQFIYNNVSWKDPKYVSELEKTIRKAYFNDKPIGKDLIQNLSELISDIHFVKDIKAIIKTQRKQPTPTYYYLFSYRGEQPTITQAMGKGNYAKGVSHADELSYMFHMPHFLSEDLKPPRPGSRDWITMERLLRLWANFAATGDPTPRQDDLIGTTWKPITEEEVNIFDIGEDVQNKVDIPSERYAAWERLRKKSKISA